MKKLFAGNKRIDDHPEEYLKEFLEIYKTFLTNAYEAMLGDSVL